jgi:hypothetical protein
MSPDGKTHNQSDHVLMNKRWCSSVVDISSVRVSNCDTGGFESWTETISK